GTVDLRTGDLRRAIQDDHITRQTATAPAAAGTVPRRWLTFLEDATRGDADLIRFLQQMAGYSLTGDTSAHALFFIYGAGGNGKSVFLNTLTGILGEYAQTAAMDTFTASANDKHPTDLAGLKGARLVSASETEDGRAWAETRIKNMTGGDPITARFMRRDFFTYRPEFKLVIVGNHKPRLNNVDDATKRRFNIIPFIHKPTAPNPELEKELRDEWPAILRWAIDGCLDWQTNGLVRPAVVVDATREYFEDQDVFGQWLEECCEREPRHNDTSAELFASWKRYAEAAGEKAGNTKTFGEAMRKRGFATWRTKSARGFEGVRVIPRAAAHDPRFPGDWDTDPERPL
ncbi:phage/plasmid primase, P4 family, partial [Ralstonia solanacearum]